MEKQKPVFVIIHEGMLPDALQSADRGIAARAAEAHKEIQRIKIQEEFYSVEDSGKVSLTVSKERPVYVCGLFEEQCVENQLWALQRKGYNASIHEKATVPLFA